jgi:hypothetical protein
MEEGRDPRSPELRGDGDDRTVLTATAAAVVIGLGAADMTGLSTGVVPA